MKSKDLQGIAICASLAMLVALAGCTATSPSPSTEPTPSNTSSLDNSDGLSTPVDDTLYPDYGNSDIDVIHYGLSLQYEPADKKLSGTAKLTIRPVTDISTINLDFSDELTVSDITVDDDPVMFNHEDLDLVIDAEAHKDRQVTVAITYSGQPKTVPSPSSRSDMTEGVGVTIGPDGAFWTFQEPYGALTWYPVNETPSDKALYDIVVSVPDGYAAVASGTYLGAQDNRYSWSSTYPTASYLVTLAIDKYEMHEMKTASGIPITVWNTKKYADFDVSLDKIPEMMTWLEERYGVYPFDSVGMVVVGGNSAMETQQMVTISGSMVEEYGHYYAEGIMVHELVHQWFGNAVTPSTWDNLWLSEGIATYAETEWRGDQEDVSIDEMAASWPTMDKDYRTMYGPPGKPDPEHFAASNSYYCPALMLHELSKKIGGEEALNKLMATWVVDHAYKNADRGDFIDFVNSYTGDDFTSFINEWLDSATTPPVDE